MPIPLSDRPRRPRPCLRRLVRDEGGAVLVFWGICLAMAFGFLALAVDFGRVAGTQSELQSFADQVALAAAGELDGRADAITRATAAAGRLVADVQTFARGSRLLSGAGDYTLTFRSALASGDSAPAGFVTTDPAAARFVTVQVATATIPTPFGAVAGVLTGREGRDTVAISAVATAGNTAFACDVTPLMFCVPDASWRADANRGDQILLRAGGQGAAWGAGNFGFLDPATLPTDEAGPCANENGANLYRCLVGAERAVTSCLRTDATIDTLTGQRTGLAEAFNTRFDIFTDSMQGLRGNAAYRPAPNTVQGSLPRGASVCRGNVVNPSDAMALPRDSCIRQGSCGRFGDGVWDRAGYVARNHGGRYPAGTNSASTRYEVYLAEIAAARTRSAPNNVPLPGMRETGAPLCHLLGATPDVERRTVVAAAVDCTTQAIRGSTRGVVALEYVRLFMTEPVAAPGGTSDAEIMVEVIGSAGGAGSGATVGSYREIVQLYR